MYYVGVDGPTRTTYDLMINVAIAEDDAISTILDAMYRVQQVRRQSIGG